MTQIVALSQTIAPLLGKTTLGQLCQVVFGMLVASGPITMPGLSRWTEKAGSYCTIQRLHHRCSSLGQTGEKRIHFLAQISSEGQYLFWPSLLYIPTPRWPHPD